MAVKTDLPGGVVHDLPKDLAEAIGLQLEAATRKAELPSYGHMPTSRSLTKEPVRLGV